jgi:hypothetical protein
MSILPAGQSLTRLVPDLEDLLHDPRAYLAQEPLRIGPRKMYGLAFLFGFAGGVLLLSCVLSGESDGERLALGIGLLIGASVWLGWSLRMCGHSLVLRPEGVEVKYLDTTVWCPWAVFNVDGHAFVPDSDSPRVGLTVPVASRAVPFVELRRDDTPIAHGAQVKAPQWQFIASDAVVLPARYEAMAGELGELLLELGRRLGRQIPKGAPPPEAYATTDLEEVPLPDAEGWITVHLTRLVFPPQCSDCGQRTNRTLSFHVESRWDAFVGRLMSTSNPLEVPIPVCKACQQRIRQQQHRHGVRGLQMGAFAFLAMAGLLTMSLGVDNLRLMFVIGFVAAAVGGIAGFIAATSLVGQLPAELGRYSPGRGTLTLRFRNPEYTTRMLAAMRAQQVQQNEHP